MRMRDRSRDKRSNASLCLDVAMHLCRQAITTIQSNPVRLKSRDEQDLTSTMVSPELLFLLFAVPIRKVKNGG